MDFEAVTTGTGDSGQSGTYSGERLFKDEALFDVLGTLDELNSWLGLIKAAVRHGLESGFQDAFATVEQLEEIQRNMHRISAEAATSPDSDLFKTLNPLTAADLTRLESYEKQLLKSVPLPRDFVVPGVTRLGATIDIGRTVCRRLERCYVRWLRSSAPGLLAAGFALRYLNRLSDYLFVLARYYEK